MSKFANFTKCCHAKKFDFKIIYSLGLELRIANTAEEKIKCNFFSEISQYLADKMKL